MKLALGRALRSKCQKSRVSLTGARYMCTSTLRADNKVVLDSLVGDERESFQFPWRNAEKRESMSLLGLYTAINHHILTNMTIQWIPQWDVDALRIYWSHEFMEGSELAFKTISKTIFSHFPRGGKASTATTDDTLEIASATPNLSEENQQKGQYDSNQIDESQLNHILDTRLANFYRDAISITRQRDYEVVHELHEIIGSRITTCELIIGGSRNHDLRGLEAHPWPFSFFSPIEVIKAPIDFDGNFVRRMNKEDDTIDDDSSNGKNTDRNGISKEELAELHVKAKELQRLATVRIGVAIDCKELFSVTDKSSGEIVQGSSQIEDTVHEVTLEAVYQLKNHILEDWIVCDIDGWMEGNRFWNRLGGDPSTP